jgi:hypothetical protein
MAWGLDLAASITMSATKGRSATNSLGLLFGFATGQWKVPPEEI